MKQILISIAILFSIQSFAQDSTRITITPQTRDVELIAAVIYNDNNGEEIFDSLKVKFRIASPPTNNTTVSLNGYTIDLYNVYARISNDPIAIRSGCAGRIETLLRNLNQASLTARLDALAASDTATYQMMRSIGRSKLRRQ